MTTLKLHRCLRCGIEVYSPGTACNDCVSTDADLVRRWRPSVVREQITRPPDCATPTAGARERHYRRGEPACQACVDHEAAQREVRRAAEKVRRAAVKVHGNGWEPQ